MTTYLIIFCLAAVAGYVVGAVVGFREGFDQGHESGLYAGRAERRGVPGWMRECPRMRGRG